MELSIIITTYNWPEALNAVLSSLQQQLDDDIEIIIADDGSTKETEYLINYWKKKLPHLIQAWQPDNGFRAARARNLAASKASGNWLIFLDGDCICPPDFISNHKKLSRNGKLIAGNRLLLSTDETKSFIRSPSNFYNLFFKQRKSLKLITLPLIFFRDIFPKKWGKVRSCNMGISKKDFFHIHGFDESYEGWGKEDSDLAIRAINAGMGIRLGQFATTVLHLHHNEASREDLEENLKRLDDLKKSKRSTPLKSILRNS